LGPDDGVLTPQDIALFKDGAHGALYEKLGAHPAELGGTPGTRFAVWAPNAERVSVKGEFNDWSVDAHTLRPREDGSGIWEGFVSHAGHGAGYRYHIVSRSDGQSLDKCDPFAFCERESAAIASRIWRLDYEWRDGDWLRARGQRNALDAPISVYEVHLGSWRRVPEEDGRFLNYRELAVSLAAYVKEMGFTHVELMPVTEHPFYGSWGYQTTGYFAPTVRYGTPQDFKYLIDYLHQQGIGVLLDWVPSHFPGDEHGLRLFDGTPLFEPADPKRAFQPEWDSYVFDYARPEVQSFLISGALFWLNEYHLDGLRVDAVSSMLYLDYAREDGQWEPNTLGGRENLEAIAFLRKLNETVYGRHPDVQMIAEESTAWPMVSRPTYLGGLGFGMKWNMGWMHDTLGYLGHDPILRKFHHERLTFSLCYAFSENFILPLSHDEVVHGKSSLLGRMPGDDPDKFANLKALLGYMYGHPGKKLLFMGAEFAQRAEWNHDVSLDWHLLEYAPHQGVRHWVRDLNHLLSAERALWELDFTADGFEWIDFHDYEKSIISFIRKSRGGDEVMLVVCNFTPVVRENYQVGVPHKGWWRELLNSDATVYGGQGYGNKGGVDSVPLPAQGRYQSLVLQLPPLSVLFFKGTAAQGQG
jgi:1,4-alpha-glucan branching enzyme